MELAEGNQQQGMEPPVAPVQGMHDASQEKVLKQSEVNELVGRIKHEAYAKGLKDAQVSAPPVQPQSNTGMGGMPQLTEEQVRQMIADESSRKVQTDAVHKVLTNFATQMGSGKGKYSDFDETVANLGSLKNYPHVIEMAADTGMADDVLYELGKNPSKIATLTTLAYMNPDLAKVEMKKLTDSIKANQEGSKSPNVNEPLSQIKPSTVGTDNGSNTVRDLRKKAWARG